MNKCITSSGPGRWQVRELYNITDEDRLQVIEDRIERAGEAEGYEVRAFSLQNAIPQLTPMVVGDDDVFIGIDDSTYYGVRGAIHMRGQSYVRAATEYFESLWTDQRAFVLRSGYGFEQKQMDSLRTSIRATANPSVDAPGLPKMPKRQGRRKRRKPNGETEKNPEIEGDVDDEGALAEVDLS